MSELILKPGPVLIWREWVYDEAKEEGSWVDSNVTSFSHEYLFETITVDDGVLLADIFRLLDAVPILTSIFRRDFSEELLIEAQKGVSPSVTSGYSPEGIEYLELYQVWNLNTATHEYEPLHRLDFHGIGYLLREDLDEGNGCIFPAGTRIHWSISTTPYANYWRSLSALTTLSVFVKMTYLQKNTHRNWKRCRYMDLI